MHSIGPGGRPVDVRILLGLDRVDAASTSELANHLRLPAGSIASKLRSLVKAELVQVCWGATPGAARRYALTEAGSRYLLTLADASGSAERAAARSRKGSHPLLVGGTASGLGER